MHPATKRFIKYLEDEAKECEAQAADLAQIAAKYHQEWTEAIASWNNRAKKTREMAAQIKNDPQYH